MLQARLEEGIEKLSARRIGGVAGELEERSRQSCHFD